MKRGNPAWLKGISGNPQGRLRRQTSLEAYYRNPDGFFNRHIRWWRFCWGLRMFYTLTEAAIFAGYSPKSARSIASRLWENPVIRARFRELRGY